MRSKPFDPLSYIPSPQTVQRHLDQTEALAHRLRILLKVAQEVHQASHDEDASADKEVPHVV
ncbi:MAG TPA: hypothetical protein VEL76_30120 [Gemmataceae bacterium]|nr:hypothetical protein [Gemmataceae bacterium]